MHSQEPVDERHVDLERAVISAVAENHRARSTAVSFEKYGYCCVACRGGRLEKNACRMRANLGTPSSTQINQTTFIPVLVEVLTVRW